MKKKKYKITSYYLDVGSDKIIKAKNKKKAIKKFLKKTDTTLLDSGIDIVKIK